MFFKNQPKTFCIVLKDNEYSLKSYNNLLDTANKFNWTVEPFFGTVGDTITSDTWKNLNLNLPNDNKFLRRKGAQGCFLSHFYLWKHCVSINEPISILEHDVLFIDYWHSIETDADLIKLWPLSKIKNDTYTGKWEVGAHAYIITPVGAKKIIEWVYCNFAYHADMLIGEKILKWDNTKHSSVTISEDNISTTRMKVFKNV